MPWFNHGYLTCKHCGVEFIGTRSQIKHFKYEGVQPYCSALCRKAGSPLRKPIPNRGPCPTCGKMFLSRQSKIYCSMKCYTTSPTFKQMVRNNAVSVATRDAAVRTYEEYVRLNTIPCKECGKPFYFPPAKHKQFCSNLCRRRYFAARFDRWIANPEEIALPQNFDEFLTQNELPCLVKGCHWFGKSLSNHMNQAHGVPKREFKRAAGFNLNSGIISADLAEVLQGRQHQGVALAVLRPDPSTLPPLTRRYVSLEAREHRAKAMAMLRAVPGPKQRCRQCGNSFQQSTPMGKTRYCCIECRTEFYRVKKAAQRYPFVCAVCSKAFEGSGDQHRRTVKGLSVVCSTHCRQTMNGRRKKSKLEVGDN